MSEPVQAWHFMSDDRKLRYGDGRPVVAGVKLTVDGTPDLCEWGLHGSVRAIDALGYAQGNAVSRTEHSGVLVIGGDKLVSTERTHIWIADAEQTLKAFSRWCALDVAHLWDMPQVVRDYLETGDESLRAAAWAAARAAAWDAAWDAARAAAWDAARAAARDAAFDRYNDKLTAMLCELGQRTS